MTPVVDDPNATPTDPDGTADGAAASEPPGPRRWIRITALVLGGVFSIWAVWWSARAIANETVRRVVPVEAAYPDGVERIEIHIAGHVRIDGFDRRGVTLTGDLTSGMFDADFEHSLSDGTLLIKMACPNGLVTCDQSLTLEVPHWADVEVHARSAELRSLTGTVYMEGTNGDTVLDGLYGPVTVDQDVGRVTATRLRSRTAVIALDAGALHVSFADAPDRVDARISAGDVTVEVPESGGPYNVVAHAGDGDPIIGILHQLDSPRTVTVRSGTGAVEVRDSL